MIEKVAPPWVNNQRNKTLKEIKRDTDYLNGMFTEEEFDRAVQYTKNTSSPGRDGIEYIMIKLLPRKYKTELLVIMNFCFEHGVMMNDWKDNDTIFIDKGNKEKVRPITMSSCVSKILERMINERLMWWAENRGILEDEQNGFRKGRSCLDNLVRLQMEVDIASRTGEKMVVAFLDVNAAYDNVLREVLIGKIVEAGCPARIIRYVEEWMTGRRTRFLIGEDRQLEMQVEKGLPQGGVLSPLLYALYTKDIGSKINPETKVIQYADDIAIIVREDNKVLLKERLVAAISQIDKNMIELELELEHEKTNILTFKYGKCKTDDMIVEIKKDIFIRTTESAKFLGIIFDRRLTWEKQINEMLGKANRIIQILKYLNRVSWGIKVNTALMLYKSYVRSIIEYGLFIYLPEQVIRV